MSIFSQTQLPSDTWTMEGAAIEFGTSAKTWTDFGYSNDMIIAVQCTIQYGRGVTRRYPINVRRAIYLVGSPQGTVTFGLLFGPGASMRTFVDKFASNKAASDASADKKNVSICITPFNTNTYSTHNTDRWIIYDPVLSQVSLQIQEGGDSNISAIGGATLEFSDMDLTGYTITDAAKAKDTAYTSTGPKKNPANP